MHTEKRRELRRLDEELQEHVDSPWDVKARNVPAQNEAEVQKLQRRTEAVSATNEYPATFSIWSQLLLAVVLPKGVQLLLAGL